ncbi:hypothetical protein [Mycobacteroides abscessus]|uniref:hypothetical protein n=1 Tax=Mycobacteroides abscessus TaxID=36809 RepID=UPI0005DFD64B|nr:hypothetical protein [Mycobacteroides abscessus]CPW94844.1 Uncharacterised protein [Mycobacteroides abscessus]SKU67091.1 Uncharacterised protein [Mycobacteroides abscessus subsp. abscessus]
MSGHTEHGEPCPETAELLARLRAAGVECERASLADVVESDLPLFFYPGDFGG